MNQPSFHRTRLACWTVNLSMSVVAMLPPLLFTAFYQLYQISYFQLGALVLINFCTQLLIDLLLSFYGHKYNLTKTIKLIPVLTAAGLLLYAVLPSMFPNTAYGGLVIGTIFFSASGGLAEVLISPIIAAIPSDNPEREMSRLHAVYAWGVVGVVIISTCFLQKFGKASWPWLTGFWTLLPVIAAVLFSRAPIPDMQTPQKTSQVFRLLFSRDFLLCFFCIFSGGASECIMSQWASSYLEQAFLLPKVWGDLLGVALFAVMLGIGRSAYAKYGKNLSKTLMFSATGALLCYLSAALTNHPLLALAACALTGLFTAMLWPGSLLTASGRFPASGVAVFALMAAGGDLGAAAGPQLLGAIVDFLLQNPAVSTFAESWKLSALQFSMKAGLLFCSIFPLTAVCFFTTAKRRFTENPQ